VQRERDGEMVELPTFDAWIEAWTPKDTLQERSLRDQAPYDLWVKNEHLIAVPGKNIRMDFVAARVAGTAAEFAIQAMAYDRYAFRKFEQECDDLGLTLNFVEHPQGGKRRAAPTEEQKEAAKLESGEDRRKASGCLARCWSSRR
jgi:phage terminase large subunit-like protein